MAGFTERLALLIDADGKGAVKELQAVGKHASTELGKADDAAVKTKGKFLDIGVGAIAFGAAVGVGAKKAIDAAQDLADANDKANATFSKSGVEAVNKFAANAADKFGLSKQQATDLAATYGNIGKAFHINESDLGSFSTTLAGLTSDLAEFSGKSTEEVQSAIQSGLSGKGKALRELGIDLEAGSKGIDAYNQILEQTRDKQGFFASQSDDVGASQERLKAKFENTKAALGESLIPVLSQGITIVGGVVDAFNSLPGPLQSVIVGAGITAAGLKAVGLDFGDVTGLVGKGREAWQKYGVDAQGSLTTAGKAIGVLGTAFVAAGVLDATGALNEALTDVKQRSIDAGNALTEAFNKGGDGIAQFNDKVGVARDTLDWGDKFKGVIEGLAGPLGNAITQWGDFQLAGQGATSTAASFNEAFQGVFDTDPAQAQRVVESLRAQNEQLDHSSDNYSHTKDLLDQWQGSLDKAAGAQDAVTGALKKGAGGYDAYTGSVDASVEALNAYGDALKANFDPLFGVIDAQKKLKDAQADATSKQWELVDAVKQHGPASIEAAAAQDVYNQSQIDAVQAALGLNGSLADLQKKMAEGSVSIDDAVQALDSWVASGMITKDQADKVKAGFNEAQRAGEDFAKSYEAKVNADFTDFYKQLQAAQKTSRNFSLGGNSPGQNNANRQNAVGGVMSAGERSLVGENGPEIFQAGASGYIIPNNRVTSSAMKPQGSDGTSITYEINVSVAPGSEADAGRALVDAIKAHERIAGPGWRQ